MVSKSVEMSSISINIDIFNRRLSVVADVPFSEHIQSAYVRINRNGSNWIFIGTPTFASYTDNIAFAD